MFGHAQTPPADKAHHAQSGNGHAASAPRARRTAANREEPVEILQQNFEAVVELLKSSETENGRLNSRLNNSVCERAAIARCWRLALRGSEDETAALAQRYLLLQERSEAAAELHQQQLQQARDEAAETRAALAQAESALSAATETAHATATELEHARRDADSLSTQLEQTKQVLEEERAAHQLALSRAAEEEKTRSGDAEQRWRAERERLEAEVAALRPLADKAASCEARAEAAEIAAEESREEMRRAVGAERQRVAGMLYKEALQSHTLDEQAKQLEELNAQLAEAEQAKRERAEAVAARNAMEEQFQALVDSKSKHVQSMLSLDEQLAQEQQLRAESQQIVQTLQAALTDRATREASTSERARRAEEALEALKKSYREMRTQLGKALTQGEKAATELRNMEAARRAAASTLPCASVQTEWVSMILPLPAPKGGA